MVEKERVNSWSCFKEDTSVCGEKGLVEWASRWRSRRRRRGCLAENPTHIRLFQPTLPNTSHQILFNRKLLKRRLISSVESELGFLGRICIIIKAIWKFKLGVRYENILALHQDHHHPPNLHLHSSLWSTPRFPVHICSSRPASSH